MEPYLLQVVIAYQIANVLIYVYVNITLVWLNILSMYALVLIKLICQYNKNANDNETFFFLFLEYKWDLIFIKIQKSSFTDEITKYGFIFFSKTWTYDRCREIPGYKFFF